MLTHKLCVHNAEIFRYTFKALRATSGCLVLQILPEGYYTARTHFIELHMFIKIANCYSITWVHDEMMTLYIFNILYIFENICVFQPYRRLIYGLEY